MDLQEKFAVTREDLNSSLIERESEIDVALTACVQREHCLFVGPPGTAKSLLAESLSRWIVGGRNFTVHCCKDTTRTSTFGPEKLSSFKKDKLERALEGAAADCHILVLEEVFKAGPAVLDMFLMLMNERVYCEGVVNVETPLQTIFGVSNEWTPEGHEEGVNAFFDRFLFRKDVQEIATDEGIEKLLWADQLNPNLRTTITPDELAEASWLSLEIPWTDEAKEALWEIIKEAEKEGIHTGDRRKRKAPSAAQAFAFVCGDSEVKNEHLEILSHVLWSDPIEQPSKVGRIIGKIANPLAMKLNSYLSEANQIVKEFDKHDINSSAMATSKLEEIRGNILNLEGNGRAERAAAKVEEMRVQIFTECLGGVATSTTV